MNHLLFLTLRSIILLELLQHLLLFASDLVSTLCGTMERGAGITRNVHHIGFLSTRDAIGKREMNILHGTWGTLYWEIVTHNTESMLSDGWAL